MKARRLTPEARRAYVRGHPLALWFSYGVALAGAVGILFPDLTTQSAISSVLPDWLRLAFSGVWMLGGICGAAGVKLGRRDLEAGGMALLSSGLACWAVTVASVSPRALGSIIFVGALAVGCGVRSHYLAGG